MNADVNSRSTPAAAVGPLRQVVRVTNPQGLHMRPASAFAKRAREFVSMVTVTRADNTVNGKSQLDLLMLAAEPGTELLLVVSGDDAEMALPVLADLLAASHDLDAE